jgi:hypothetical protein
MSTAAAIKDTNHIPNLLGDMDAILDRIANKVGDYVAGKIVDKIQKGDPSWPPNAAATIAKKGSSKPWIDKGEILQLIENTAQSVRVDGARPKVVQIGIFEHEKGFIAHILEEGSNGGSISAGGIMHTWDRIPARPLFSLVFQEEELNVGKIITDELNKEFEKYGNLKPSIR